MTGLDDDLLGRVRRDRRTIEDEVLPQISARHRMGLIGLGASDNARPK